MLDDLEKTKIEQFMADEAMVAAVKKVLLKDLYYNGIVTGEVNPLINGAFQLPSQALTQPISNELLGENLRAQFAGVCIIDHAFENMKTIKVGGDVESPYNENEAV